MSDYWIMKYVMHFFTFSLTNDRKRDIYNTEGIWSHNWRERKHSANNLLKKKKNL